MTEGYISLSAWDIVLAAVFLCVNAGLSVMLRLRLERQLAIAAARMVVQLLMIGLVLKTIFALASPGVTALAAIAMCLFAAREIRARQARHLTGIWGYGLGGSAMMLAGSLVTVFGLTAQIQPSPWWTPQIALPLFGMILGNTMTGVSLGLDSLHMSAHRERRAIEAQLLVGRRYLTAMLPVLRQALRSGFTPIINSMAATGVVSLPGMMTGQILAGVDPQEAVKYQIMVLFLIGGSTGLGVLAAVLASAWRLTDERQRLRLDRLSGPVT